VLVLKGALVTLDAAGCRTSLLQQDPGKGSVKAKRLLTPAR
jgi:hypothetical protein